MQVHVNSVHTHDLRCHQIKGSVVAAIGFHHPGMQTRRACNKRRGPSIVSFLATFHVSVPRLSSSSIQLFILSDLQLGRLHSIVPSLIVPSSEAPTSCQYVAMHFRAFISSFVSTLLRLSQS